MKTTRRFSRGEVAFTLVEVLVAEAIFLILLLIVMQVIFGALQTTTAQKKHMDELGDARQSLDRLSLDWAARVRRNDIYATFTNASPSSTSAANAQIGFLTQAQWYTPSTDTQARHLAWVTYGVTNVTQVNQGSTTVQTPGLVRSLAGYDWNGSANPVLTLPMTTAPTSTSSTTTDPLGNTVFCFGYCFLQQMPTTSSTYPQPFTINPGLTLTSTNLVGVVVAIASLDQQSRQVLTQAQLVAMGNALLPVPDGQSPQTYWLSQINSGVFATTVKAAGVPASVANAVHVYQRILYVND